MDDVTGFVLAGGRSERMGTDKALLDWQGCTLLSRAVELARCVAADVRIVGSREKFARFGPAIEDIYPSCGPLGGIHAALASSVTDLNLLLAVDTPFLQAHFLEYLVAQARQCRAVVTVPRTHAGWQPLCAIYGPAFANLAEAALRAGRNKIDALFTDIKIRVIDEGELHDLGLDPAMFDNLNTREDLERARARQVRSA